MKNSLGCLIVETACFTRPFIRMDRLQKLGLVGITNNGGAWRRVFEGKYRITVVYTTQRAPNHKNTVAEDEQKFERLRDECKHFSRPMNGHVLGLYVWGRVKTHSRHIPTWIRNQVCGPGTRCIICDEERDIECDHVDDDYTVDVKHLKAFDFQALCQSCNKKKREAHNRGIRYYRDIRDPGKAIIRQLLDLPHDFSFDWISPEEESGKSLFYRNPKRVRMLHFEKLKNDTRV